MTETANEPKTAAPAKKEAAATTYVVLVLEPAVKNDPAATELTARLWHHVGEIQARSAEAAIRKHAEKVSDPSAGARVLVAIPARSFQPVKVTPKVETTLLIEDVKGP